MVAYRQIDFLARTWIERGVCVPFTTPDLTRARMRRDDNGRREFILPNLSGGKGCYVMAWNTIRTMIPVSMHDRLLYDLIENHEVDNPLSLHKVLLQVASSGLAGPDATRRAMEEIEGEQQYQVLTTFMLVLQIMRARGIASPDYLSEGVHSATVQRSVRAALQAVAADLGIPYDEVYGRVEALGALLTPVGLVGAVDAGRLRLLVSTLGEFRDSVRAWSEQALPEVSELAEFQARAADFVCIAAAVRLAQIDQALVDVTEVLTNWETRREAMAGAIRELGWLLDGWGRVLDLVRTFPATTAEDRATLVTEVYPFTPIIPSSAMSGVSEQQLQTLSAIQRRRVRAHTDWRTGMTDFEQVRRIETYKLAAPEPGKRS